MTDEELERRDKQGRNAGVFANARFMTVETYSGRGLLCPDPEGAWYVFETLPSDEVLGGALLRALAESRFLLSAAEFPLMSGGKDTWGERRRELMARFHLRSAAAVFRETAHVMVRERRGQIALRPLKQDRGDAWSANSNDPVHIASGMPPSSIGASVREALRRCGGFDFEAFERSAQKAPGTTKPEPQPQ
jgi:hypothetical protein